MQTLPTAHSPVHAHSSSRTRVATRWTRNPPRGAPSRGTDRTRTVTSWHVQAARRAAAHVRPPEERADAHPLAPAKPSPAQSRGRAQRSPRTPFRTQHNSQTSASWLETGLSVKEVSKTTFPYNYTLGFYFQNTFLLTHGCTGAASPGVSLDTHPHAPACVKLSSCAVPSLYTKPAIAKRKRELFSGQGESTYPPHEDPNPFAVGEAPGTAKPLGRAVELLQCAGPVTGGQGGCDAAMLPPFPERPEVLPYIRLSSGKAYLDGRRCRMLIPRPHVERALIDGTQAPFFTGSSGSFLKAPASAGANVPRETSR